MTRPGTRPGRPATPARSTAISVSAAAAITLAIAGGVYWYGSRQPVAPKLTDKDTIVLAEFTNTTGDPVFDGALRQGLAVQLQQSPFLSLVPEPRIQQTLRLMGEPDERDYSEPGATGLRTTQQRCRARRVDREPGKSVRAGSASHELPDRLGAR